MKKRYLYKLICIIVISLLPLNIIKAEENKFNIEIRNQDIVDSKKEDLIKYQKEIDERIIEEYSSGNYTLQNPYIKLDPYEFNPLCALVMFETQLPAKVKVTVIGDIPIESIYNNYSKEHQIPVTGLYNNKINQIKIDVEYENGKKVSNIIEIKTENNNVPGYNFNIIKENEMSAGIHYIGSTGKNFGIDNKGEIRLILNGINYEFEILPNGNWLVDGYFKGKVKDYYSDDMMEINRLGKIVKYYDLPYDIHHDHMVIGNTMLVTSQSNDGYYEDVIIEVDLETGDIIQEIDFKNILDSDRIGFIQDGSGGDLEKDWLHINSVYYSDEDNGIIVSARHQGIIKINKDTHEIQWILSDPTNWGNSFEQYLLTPKGENFEYPYGQHYAKLTTQGNLVLYDNGNNRSLDPEHIVKAEDNYSRAVEYKIDEKHKTIEQVREFGREYGSELYTPYVGSALMLDNENMYICFGGIVKDENNIATNYIHTPNAIQKALITEVNTDNEEILQITMDYNIYRAKKVSLAMQGNEEKIVDPINQGIILKPNREESSNKIIISKKGKLIPITIFNKNSESINSQHTIELYWSLIDSNTQEVIKANKTEIKEEILENYTTFIEVSSKDLSERIDYHLEVNALIKDMDAQLEEKSNTLEIAIELE